MKSVTVIVCFLVPLTVFGQDTVKYKWFTGINIGYGTGVLKNVVDEDVKGSAIAPSTKAYEKDRKASIGNGFRLSGLIGYQIDTASFIEFNVSYSKSNPMTFTTQIFQSSVDNSPYYITSKKLFSHTIYSSMQYGLNYPICSKWVGVIKSGVIIGKSYISGESTTITYGFSPIPTPASYLQYKYRYSSTLSIGFIGSAGLCYSLSKRIRLAFDLNLQLLSTRITSRETIEYSVDGQSKLQELSPSEKNISYYDGKPNNTTNQNQPLVVPVNNINATLGFNYLF
ncbi:MAG TPA: hypothetical protein VEC12_08520 [Bacteroidia bacterium]|nr:hypothetical protein [Bacteroidia bacterium]